MAARREYDEGMPDHESPAQAANDTVSCRGCGHQAPLPALGWSHDTEFGWLCEACVRVNLRNIEAKLDTEWW
ncbi:hypothetical protein GCM10009765_63710 [Fodinicola feengrottensis]|uniref:Uncharacterized protein n=1 Tax=Fodinicola feengrottensis TaxID=435914 RepID=A0ABN2IIC8_9ACTN